MQELDQVLRPSSFALYYQRSGRPDSLDDVMLGLPIKLAYKAPDTRISDFDLSRISTSDGAQMWQLKGGSGASKQPL